MKQFSNDYYPRGTDFSGTKESLYEAGRILQQIAEGLDESDLRVTEKRLESVKALLENAAHDERISKIIKT